jgi:hypothetical protein
MCARVPVQVRAKKANYMIQTGVLIHRGFKHMFRNYAYLVSQLLETVLMAIAMVSPVPPFTSSLSFTHPQW